MKSFRKFLTESNITSHIGMIATMMSKNLAARGLRHPSVLLRDYGKSYTFGPDSFEGKRQSAHMCFRNAAQLSMDTRGLTYVEGYVDVLGVPIEHAWCVTKQGRVVDPTLDGKHLKEYYGVPIKQSYLTKTILKTKMWGVLSPMSNPAILSDDPKDIIAK